ncbi:MAG TPA: GNAT family N-acetyltransferase [Candidatus Bathyarchaeia archaeon]|nr:GNAT family N-acetyltransferase [Candidatus Bathyarchaeia archaeon]
MFHIKKMTPEDFEFAVELANTMNWNMVAGDFEFNAKLEPHGCLVLLDGSEKIGVATCISYGKMGWFGNLIVKEAYRQKGAGTLLVKHALSYLSGLGVKAVGLYAYEWLVDFYGKLGFKYDRDFLVLKANNVSLAKFGELRTAAKEHMPAVVNLDAECFGASRKKVLESILLNMRNVCYVSAENDKIIGFATAKVYDEMAEFGPLVCASNRTDIAVELLEKLLWRLRGLEGWMCLPAAETTMVKTALRAGFKEESRVARMFLGSIAAEDCLYVAESLERG